MKPVQSGSFVTPEQLAKMSVKSVPVEETPVAESVQTEPVQEKPEVDATAEFKRVKKANEDALGITITEDDVNNYIFRGRIVKKDVQAIRNKVIVTFQSLTPKELEAVDQTVSAVKDSSRHTLEGINNLRTIEQLSYAWLEINGKPLPKEHEKRKEAITHMGTHVVNRVVEAYRGFDILLEMSLREEEFLKK